MDKTPTVTDATFVAEARDVRGLPPEGPPEIAIAGRSNVGKSTLLNRLAGRRALARVSKTPGRTRGLVFFDLAVRPAGAAPRRLRIADLPGYGYAQVAKTERREWQKLVEGYAKIRRPRLALFVLLADARRGPDAEEEQMAEWLEASGMPYVVALTKADKLGASAKGAARGRWRGALLVSGETGEGVDRLWATVLAAADAVPAAPAAAAPAEPV